MQLSFNHAGLRSQGRSKAPAECNPQPPIPNATRFQFAKNDRVNDQPEKQFWRRESAGSFAGFDVKSMNGKDLTDQGAASGTAPRTNSTTRTTRPPPLKTSQP
jgi:hypothetical protein